MKKGTSIDLEKMRSIGFLSKGRTRDKTREFRRDDGVRVKETTDELGTVVTEHNTKDDRVDVNIHPDPVKVDLVMK